MRAFRILREQEFFKKIDTTEYVVWCDCGKHFRNGLFVGYLFRELRQYGIHGKMEKIINILIYLFTNSYHLS